VAAAITVFFLFLLIGRFALRGKGVVSGKLATILAIFVGLWVLMAVSDLSEGDHIVAWLAGGVAALFHGIADFPGFDHPLISQVQSANYSRCVPS
jgi:hypothetical protein